MKNGPARLTILCIVSLLGFSILGITSVSGRYTSWVTSGYAIGGGTIGTGSIAVAAFFSSQNLKGAGAFSGSLMPLGIGGTNFDVAGIFSLTDPNPTLPVLPCGPAGEIGASGRVIAGSFLGQQVVVASCLDKNNFTVVLLSDGAPNCIGSPSRSGCTYSGAGIGNIAPIASSILAGAVIAGNTSGAGSAGSGGVDMGKVILVLIDGRLQGGGAFVGSLGLPVPVAGITSVTSISARNGCETDLSGAVSAGSFSGQRETTSFVPVTCPPTSIQQGRVLLDGTVGLTIGAINTPIYTGKGPGLVLATIG